MTAPDGPVGSDGKKLHGVVLENHLRREAELTAARTARDDIEGLARIVAMLAARVTRLPAPDALRVVGGQHGQADALAVLRAAGLDPHPQAARWEAERPAERRVSTSVDPEHSAEAMAALRDGGIEAYRAVVAGLAAARDAGRAQRQADRGVLWETRSGEQVTEDAGTRPRPQTSRVYSDPQGA